MVHQGQHLLRIAFFLLGTLGLALGLHAQFTTNWVKGWYGGNYSDEALCVELDRQGNMITAGTYETGTIDLDPGPGTFYGPPVTRGTGWVEKLDSNGAFVWARIFEATSQPTGVDFGMSAIDVDTAGNIYLAITNRYGVDADPGPSVLTLPPTGGGQVAVIKLNPAGNLIWAFQFGGYTSDYAFDIQVLPGGDFVLSGFLVNSADFDPGPGVTMVNVGSNGGTFFARYTSSGALVWAKSITSSIFGNYPGPIAVTAAGECYLSGSIRGTGDIDPGPGVYTVSASSQSDMYLIKLDAAGNLLWANFWGGQISDQLPARMILDSQGHLIFSFTTHGSMDVDPGAGVASYNMSIVSDDGIIAKFTPAGQLQWFYAVNATSFDRVNAIDIDRHDNIFFGHWFTGTHDFDPGPGTASFTSGSTSGSAYVCYLDSSGTFQDVWAITDPAMSMVQGLAMRPDGTGYAAGNCGVSADFDMGPGVSSPGCPSAVNVYFWKWHPCLTTYSTTTVTACDSFAWGGQVFHSSGNYTQTFASALACDSVATLRLTVNQSTSSNIIIHACDSTQVNGQTYTSSGNYTQSLTNALGCDSTLLIELHIDHASTGSYVDTFCNAISVNGQTYTASGTYQQILQSQAGCDSLLTLQLTQVTVDTTVTLNGSQLQAQPGATSYQWLDCENSFAPIPSATQATYTTTLNGTFAVAISNGICTDTSSCHVVIVTNANASLHIAVQIFPNPTSGTLQINVPSATTGFEIQIHNSLGQHLSTQQFQNSQAILHLPYPEGQYHLQITPTSGPRTQKIIQIQK